MTSVKQETYNPSDLKYLGLLSQKFPTVSDAATEIVNLEAILNLPKGTEHFLTDLHGEFEAFQHVLKNASGVIRQKVNEIFGNTLREAEKRDLCTLIYYPEQKLELIKRQEGDLNDWYRITLNQLTEVCRNVSTKYTRSKVRKALPRTSPTSSRSCSTSPMPLLRPTSRSTSTASCARSSPSGGRTLSSWPSAT